MVLDRNNLTCFLIVCVLHSVCVKIGGQVF